MNLQLINVGNEPNDNTGDVIRTAFIKCNDNFTSIQDEMSSRISSKYSKKTVLNGLGSSAVTLHEIDFNVYAAAKYTIVIINQNNTQLAEVSVVNGNKTITNVNTYFTLNTTFAANIGRLVISSNTTISTPVTILINADLYSITS